MTSTTDQSAVNVKVILLGAGRPYRGISPSAIQETPDRRHVLDWILEAFSWIPAEFCFVGGYHLEEVVRQYPNISYAVNPEWNTTGSVESIFIAPLSLDQPHYVCYSDVVFRHSVVEGLRRSKGDVVLAVDRRWRHRYEIRSAKDMEAAEKVQLRGDTVCAVGTYVPVEEADAEFTGLVKFSSAAMIHLLKLRDTERRELRLQHFPALLSRLVELGVDIRAVDVGGHWAELNAPQDLARFVLGTKAETLERLRPMVRHSSIGEQVALTAGGWKTERDICLDQIAKTFGSARLIVRSSALSEDCWDTAKAGTFLSVLDIPGGDRAALARAIDRVVKSYSDDNAGHQVLVQEMVQDTKASGVAFTRTLSYGAPYYVINYDDTTLSTDTVTGGSGQNLKTLIVHREWQSLPASANPLLQGLLPALQELEQLVGHDSLDVEFAVDRRSHVHIFQVRPIAVDHSSWRGTDDLVGNLLANAERTFRDKQMASPFVLGRRTFFGVMPDWNPAEIIGTKPRRLALSLYRYLVTDEVWATQRAEYGYQDVRPQPLLVSFAGHPYIDIRCDFNSFIPASLPTPLAERLADHYLDRLETHPHLHDKVEFDIVYTCLTLDFNQQARRLFDAGFTKSEVERLREALREITSRAFERSPKDFATIDLLEKRFQQIAKSNAEPLNRAFTMLIVCRRYGTLPFAHLARSAFVAVALLRSAANEKLISWDDVSAYLTSLNTVARRFATDASAVTTGSSTWENFVERYGHLRPGTYEITSPSYAQEAERYLRPVLESTAARAPEEPSAFSWTKEKSAALSNRLRRCGLPDDIDHFDAFVRTAIEGREYSKFVFTRNLSAVLENLAEFGAGLGLSRDDLSHVAIEDFAALWSGQKPPDVTTWLRERSVEGAAWHTLAQGIELPPLITRIEDFRSFVYPESQPNFVSAGNVTAELICLADDIELCDDLEGKIVLIPRADPGYDWLFGHRIAGLLTAYGGANSHMAIRAAEFGLPAAIGIGESLYEKLSRAHVVCLDCQHRRIQVVR